MRYLLTNIFLKKLFFLVLFTGAVLTLLVLILSSTKDVPSAQVEVERNEVEDFTLPFRDLGLPIDKYLGVGQFTSDNQFFVFTGEGRRDEFEYDVYTAVYDFYNKSAKVVSKEFVFGNLVRVLDGFVFSAKDGLFYYSASEESTRKIYSLDIPYYPLGLNDSDKYVISMNTGILGVDVFGTYSTLFTQIPHDRPLLFTKDNKILFFARDVENRQDVAAPLQQLYFVDTENSQETALDFVAPTKIIKLEWLDEGKGLAYLRTQDEVVISHYVLDIDKGALTKIGEGDEEVEVDVYDGFINISTSCVGRVVDANGISVLEYSLEKEGTCKDVRMLGGETYLYVYTGLAGDVLRLQYLKDGARKDFTNEGEEGVSYILSKDRKKFAVPENNGKNFVFFETEI